LTTEVKRQKPQAAEQACLQQSLTHFQGIFGFFFRVFTENEKVDYSALFNEKGRISHQT